MSHTIKPSDMTVSHIMTRKVFTIRLDKKLIVVKEIMDWAHVRHVPVVDNKGSLVGLVSHRDLLGASLAIVDKARTEFDRKNWLAHILVKDIMQQSLLAVNPTTSVAQVANMMCTKKIGCVPVVESGKMIGIVTEHDLLQIVEKVCAERAA